jgi:hypothetical protein
MRERKREGWQCNLMTCLGRKRTLGLESEFSSPTSQGIIVADGLGHFTSLL